MASNTDHSFLVRVLSKDGEVLMEDTDFSEGARFDWFDEILRQSDEGDIVQLIDTSDDRVITEQIREYY